jgi:hypothetical protein
MKAKYISFYILTVFTFLIISSCGEENPIIKLLSNEVTAKERLDSANAQAKRKYGVNTNLILVMGKNVKSNGKTDISAITAFSNPDSIGAWLYVFRAGSDTSLRVYTPNPIPTTTDCIELTALFNVNSLLSLIADTSARNIVSGAVSIILSQNISITTSTTNLIDSDNSLNLGNTTNPIIKFNSSFTPDTSSLNGNVFFSSGTEKKINMFLIPAVGTLHLPTFIQDLTGFPNDLWIANYKKMDSNNNEKSLILGTVVESNQTMHVANIGISSKVINLSKYVEE